MKEKDDRERKSMKKSGTRFLCMDVDGTLTDGTIYVGENGEVMKGFDVKDGYGIARILPALGIEPVIITGRKSKIVEQRSMELSINIVRQGVVDKLKALEDICKKNGVGLSQIAYAGDDLNDYDCMEAVRRAGGKVGCPSDAVQQIKAIASYVADSGGGKGAVREFIEWIAQIEK